MQVDQDQQLRKYIQHAGYEKLHGFLALIIAVPALISMVTRPGAGALWSPASALVFMAPAGLAGDWIRLSRLRKNF
jgi:hypothetical protein